MAAERLGSRSRTVLVVDDELAFRTITARLLEQAGFIVKLAPSSQAALSLLQADPQAVGVIVSDVRMPEMNGLDFAVEVRRNWPDIPISLMSAREPDELKTTHVTLAGIPFIRKPFTIEELVQLVETLASAAPSLPSHRTALPEMVGRHVGRLAGHPFVLRLSPSAVQDGHPSSALRYWEIEYEGQAYPWRPVHPEDEQDVAKLVRTAMTYLQRDLRRHG